MNKKLINLIIVLIILLWVVPSNAVDKEALFNKQINHKARFSSTWSELIKKDLKNRILPAPDIIIDYLINENLLQGYKERPKKAEIEQESNNNRKAAIQYILLHEIGHVIGVAKGAHPHWAVGGDPQKWSLSKLSWLSLEGGLKGKSKFDDIFTKRSKIKFYSFENASLTSKDIKETYAMYVHVVLQNRLWKIRIIKEGETVEEITNPILDKRCENKKRYMDILFE